MSEANVANLLPKYMEKGSRGPFCVAVNAFLTGHASAWGMPDSEFAVDQLYGGRAVELMKSYQSDSNLEDDGGCGPKTRTAMKEDGFDVDVVANCLPGVTVFVQPDGSEISWSPQGAAMAAAAPVPRMQGGDC